MKRIVFFCLCCIAFLPSTGKAQVVISGSIGANGSYATLSAAFTALNGAAAQTGATITLSINGNLTEPASPAALTYKNWTALTIQPSGARTVTGTPTSQVVGFNGARLVTVDGLNSGGNSLSILSTNTLPAVVLYNAASSNTIKNTTLNSNSNSLTSGVLVFTTPGSNNNNTIDNCDIAAYTGGNPFNLVYSNGASGALNSGNIIQNCRLYDNFNPSGNSNGILLDTYNDRWTISSNKFYQTASRTTTSGTPVYAAININGCTGDNFTINSNYIGGSTSAGTGNTIYGPNTQAVAFKGIILGNAGPASASLPSNSSVRFNQLKGIQVSSNKSNSTKGNNIFIGIEINNGATTDAAMVKSNIIGATTGTNHIRIDATSTSSTQVGCYGIYNRSSKGNYIDSNYFGGITMAQAAVTARTTDFSCIYSDPATNSLTSISYNSIGNSSSNSITTPYNNATLYGIELANTATTGTSYTIRENSIHDMQYTGTSAGSINYPLAGIIGVSGGDQLFIYDNTVSSLSFSGSFGSSEKYIAGIRCTGQTGAGALPNYVYNNWVYDLQAISNSTGDAGMIGMSFVGLGGTHYVYNNIVSLGSLCFTNVIGINHSASNGTLYLSNNSIYLNGNDSYGLSTCLRKYTATASTVTMNNVFYNYRSGTPTTTAVYVVNSLTALGPYTGNYNLLYSVSDYLTRYNSSYYQTLSDWQTVIPSPSSEGTGSKSAYLDLFDPSYRTIHPELINAGTNLSAATPPVTDDIDGKTRGSCYDIGAYEIWYQPGPEDLTWTASINNNWCEPCNWDKGIAPDSTYNAYVNALPATGPVVDASGTCVSPLPEVKDLYIESGATLSVNASALEIFGDLHNSGTVANSGGNIGFTSSLRDQNINSTSPLQLNNLYIRGLANRKYMNTQVTVNNFTHCVSCAANLILGNYTLYINSAATGSLSSHIVTNGLGKLIHKNINAAARFFPIGYDETHYNPVSIANGDNKDYSANVQPGITPAGNTNPLLGVNRTWTLTASSPPSAAADVRFYYYDTDVNGSCNPHSNMYLAHYYTSPIAIWNIDQGNRPVSVGAPNSVLFNIENWTGVDPFVIGNQGLVLAINNSIQLTAKQQNNSALLEWRIGNSYDVTKFEVLHSTDGINFQTIGNLNAISNLLQYLFTDMNLSRGDHYYRVRLWNGRGESLSSNIAVLKGDIKDIISLQPSIVNNQALLSIFSVIKRKVVYQVINAEGKIVATKEVMIDKGENRIPVLLNGLAPGMYYFRTDMGNDRKESIRFIKQ